MSRRFKVYTRTGDKGTSQLYNLERRPKDDHVFQALGDTDELNAHIGLAIEHCRKSGNGLDVKLVQIQSRLLDIGSAIATPLSSSRTKAEKAARVAFDGVAHTKIVEQWIDEMDEALPPLKNFILPSGGLAASQLHVCRSVCRRAERRVVALGDEDLDASVFAYVNRLSDFFFVAARFAAQHDGQKENVYKKEEGKDDDAAGADGEKKDDGKGTTTSMAMPFHLIAVQVISVLVIVFRNMSVEDKSAAES
jgi:cob(I)alamin adenosyltransferase